MKVNNNKIYSMIIVFIITFLYFSNENLKVASYDLLGSKYFPRIICIIIFLLSIILFFKKEGKEGKEGKEIQKKSYKRIILFVIFILLYLIALEYGSIFIYSTFIFLVLSFLILSNYEYKQLPQFIIISFISTYSIYYIFKNILKIFFP